jgi:fructose-1,6-bisphosphatase/sedoheptulose 1,7-bisphosphatase-like protein
LDKSIGEIEIVVLDKPRHKELISRIRKIGAKVREIPDGDVMGAFEVLVGHIDALFGIGGAPEGIIMAAMTKALGGEFQGQLTPQSDAERAQIISFDASIIDTVFDQDALILAEPVVAITSVTGAGVLEPVTYRDGSLYISSALIRNGSYSVVSQFA